MILDSCFRRNDNYPVFQNSLIALLHYEKASGLWSEKNDFQKKSHMEFDILEGEAL